METNISELLLSYWSHAKEITAGLVYKIPAHLRIPLRKEFSMSTEQYAGENCPYITMVVIRNSYFFVDIYRV